MRTSVRPRVSVIIATQSNPRALGVTLDSVLSQTFEGFEVWVIGNRCADHTEDVVLASGDPRVFWYNRLEESDTERLLLEGVRRARGEFVAYLCEGDLWMPNHIEAMVNHLEGTAADIAVSVCQRINAGGVSVIQAPELSDFSRAPDRTVVVHRKSVLTFAAGTKGLSYETRLFQIAAAFRLRMEIVPVTTGLKFSIDETKAGNMREKYLARIRKDPDFINRELSSILLRSERASEDAGRKWRVPWPLRMIRQMLSKFTLRTIATRKHAVRNEAAAVNG